MRAIPGNIKFKGEKRVLGRNLQVFSNVRVVFGVDGFVFYVPRLLFRNNLKPFFFIFYWEAGFEKATTRFSTSVRISLFGQLMYAIDSIGAEMATEKAQQAVLKGVEGFDPASLKPTETQEKVVLPGAAG